MLSNDPGGLPVRRTFALIAGAVAVFVAIIVGTMTFETVNGNQILLVQGALNGKLHWYTTPGVKWQGFGHVVKWPRVLTYAFQDTVRFNEGGHAAIIGSIQFRMPDDDANLTSIYKTYGTSRGLVDQLLETVTDKSIFMTGPLLSSTESYAEKRSNLIFWIEDQIKDGVYKTVRRDVKTKDPITGEEKTVSVAEISITKDGMPERQEPSQLAAFGIKPFNFAVASMPYDEKVEKQIQAQQELIMGVQMAAAESRRAEQQALTAEQQGRANAATERWKQEAIRAQKVTEYQQRLDVARLDAAAAEQERKANILRGEGEAQRRRLVMAADGALTLKLDAWLESQKVWAAAVANYKGDWVPSVVMGSGNGTSGSGATSLIDMLTAKTARDLGLDLRQRTRATTGDQ